MLKSLTDIVSVFIKIAMERRNPDCDKNLHSQLKTPEDEVRELAYAEFGEDVLCRVDSVGMFIEDDTRVIGR